MSETRTKADSIEPYSLAAYYYSQSLTLEDYTPESSTTSEAFRNLDCRSFRVSRNMNSK